MAKTCLLWLCCLILGSTQANLEPLSNESAVKVSKCCEIDALLVETAPGRRDCKKRSDLLHIDLRLARSTWGPAFYDNGREVLGPKSMVLQTGVPKCDFEGGDVLFAAMNHGRSDDELMLLTNGSMSHRLVHSEKKASDRRLYAPDKYCMDDLIITHNYTLDDPSNNHNETTEDELIYSFSYLCINTKADIKALVDHYIYPIGLSVSMMCFILTFLLYSFLPQLRDLTGKFILAICSFLAMAFAAMLVQVFGWRDTNVQEFATEIILHTSIVGMWVSLSAMGHHVWKMIKSESVFTRVSDGQRLRWYSLYIFLSTAIILTVALCVHYFIEEGKGVVNHEIGWSTMAAFYTPVALVLLVNLYFYWTSQKRVSKQLIYNRTMQHFQVNFDLFTKFLVVIGIWWLFHTLSLFQYASLKYTGIIFNLVEGPAVFCVAMCRTRVAFLFKKYFCGDWCCFKSEEFINEECQELATIDMLRSKVDEPDSHPNGLGIKDYLQPFINGHASSSSNDKEMSKSLFNMRNNHREPGEIPPPPNPEIPVGRIKRLLKSNSLTALTNINFGWRKETAV